MVQAAEHPTTLAAKPSGTFPRARAAMATIVAVAVWWAWFGPHWNVFLTLGLDGPRALLLLAVIAALLAAIPQTRAIGNSLSAPLRHPKPRTQRMLAVAIATVSTVYLAWTAKQQGRALYPVVHDEFSYLIGAQMLARGRLWMPPHPLAHFFDSFQLIVDPVYASAYFPGTALLFALPVLAHIPIWLFAAAMAGIIVALLYLLVTRLIHGTVGLLAAGLLLSAGMFRTLSVMVTSQVPVMLFGLIALLAWFSWHESRRSRWAMLLGIASGWALITRPIDAICFLLPIGIAALIERRHLPRLICWTAIGLAPFLLIQLSSNKGITGHFFETPFRFYADRDHPLTSFGFHAYVAGTRPVSDLPQKQDLYLRNYVPLIIDHTPANVPAQWWPARLRETFTLDSSAPFAVLVLIALVGLLTAPRLQWAVLGSLPLFVILYACYVFFLPHYTIIVAPAIIVAIVIGLRALPQLAPLRAQRMVSAWLMIMTIGLTVAALPQWDATANDQMFASPMIGSVNEALASLGGQRVVVLFRYDPQRNVHEEPVYNADVAWPDDAQIIRAHDRGIENTRIYRYYAEHQPDRVFYRFDEATKSLQRLGSATALAAQSK